MQAATQKKTTGPTASEPHARAGYDAAMAHGMHPDTQLIHDGVRINLRIKPLPKRGGGVLNREIAEVSDAVVILPLLPPTPTPAPGSENEKTSGDISGGVVLIRNERFTVKETLLGTGPPARSNPAKTRPSVRCASWKKRRGTGR